MNQKPYGDAGATLGGNKAQRRIKTLTFWTPSQWKASPCHITMRKQAGSCRHKMLPPNWLGRHSLEETGEHQLSHGIPPATPGIYQHSPLGRLTSLQEKKKNWTIVNKLKISKQQRWQECWKHTKKGGMSKELISTWTIS
jgi:hypothetical protein